MFLIAFCVQILRSALVRHCEHSLGFLLQVDKAKQLYHIHNQQILFFFSKLTSAEPHERRQTPETWRKTPRWKSFCEAEGETHPAREHLDQIHTMITDRSYIDVKLSRAVFNTTLQLTDYWSVICFYWCSDMARKHGIDK